MDKSPRVCIDRVIGHPHHSILLHEKMQTRLRGFDEPLRAAIVLQKKWPEVDPNDTIFGRRSLVFKTKSKRRRWSGLTTQHKISIR